MKRPLTDSIEDAVERLGSRLEAACDAARKTASRVTASRGSSGRNAVLSRPLAELETALESVIVAFDECQAHLGETSRFRRFRESVFTPGDGFAAASQQGAGSTAPAKARRPQGSS